jgi:hypothetical protein
MSQEEIDGFVARLFDKDPPTARPDTLPLPYSNENSPPSVRITVLLLNFFLARYTFLCLVTQDLYPNLEIDVALSDEDNVGPNEPVGDDARGNGVPSAETLAPNLIGSCSVGVTCPSAIVQAVPTVPSADDQKKKHVMLGTKRKHNKAADDQVIIELPSYRGPQSPHDIVIVEHLSGHLFEAFQHRSQAPRTQAPTGDGAQPSKRARAPSLKKLFVPKYVLPFFLILSSIFILVLTLHLSIGDLR